MTPQTAAEATISTRTEGPWVSAEWLQHHLHDPALRIVEVDVSPTAYDSGHVEGAVLWDVYRDLKTPAYEPIDLQTFRHLLESSGISTDSTIVFYGYAPAMGFWLMKLMGHNDVRLLDCSREAWPARGRTWSSAPPSPLSTGYPEPPTLAPVRADIGDVASVIDDPSVTLLDVRSAAEYAGDCFWPSGGSQPGGRSGHIPGAVRLPPESLLHDDGTFRSAADVRRAVADLGIRADTTLITYCTVGGRASSAWFALTHLAGRPDVRVFDGSWAQWGLTPTAPVTST